MKVFISHSSDDKTIADALRELLKGLFKDQVQIVYSSSKHLDEKIGAGANWLGWICEQVRTCDHALVVVTPESAKSLWPMWECGAVTGVALALQQPPSVTPILYCESKEMPLPLQPWQAVDGRGQSIWEVIGTVNRSLRVQEESLGVQEEALEALFEKKFGAYQRAVKKFLGGKAPPNPRLTSDYIIARIHVDIDPDHGEEERRANSKFIASSDDADDMFHYNRGELVGKQIEEVDKHLEHYADPDQWKYVAIEQEAIIGVLLLGRRRAARLPLIFLEGDQAEAAGVRERFRGKAFLPVIVQHSQTKDTLDLTTLYAPVPGCLTREGDDHWACDLEGMPDCVRFQELRRELRAEKVATKTEKPGESEEGGEAPPQQPR